MERRRRVDGWWRAAGRIVVCAGLAWAGAAQAGVVRTLDGKAYEGDVTVDAGGKLVVSGAAGKNAVDWDNVLYARLQGEDRERGNGREPRRGGRDDEDQPEVVRTQGGKLPPGWEAAGLGNVGQPPYAKYTEGVYSIKSTMGEWSATGKRESACFVRAAALPAGGDAEIVARLVDVKDPGRVSAGLMARAGRAADEVYAGLVYADGGVRFVRRTKAGERATAAAGARPGTPVWLRLVRGGGNAVSAYVSGDGRTWDAAGSATMTDLPKGEELVLGLAVSGAARTEPLGAHFDNVRAAAIAPVPAATQVGGAPGAAALMPTTIKRGIVFRSGTYLAHPEIDTVADGTLRYAKDQRRDGRITMGEVARLYFRDTSPEMLAKIPAGRPGVLLKNGDFTEGEVRSMRDGRIEISSVLFGIQRADVGGGVYAIVAGDAEPAKAELVVRTTDGSVYCARGVRWEKDRLLVDDSSAGEFALPPRAIAEVAAGPSRLVQLAGLKPSRIEPAKAAVGDGGTGLTLGGPATLAGAAAPSTDPAIGLAAGAAATWDLAGQYRLLTFRAGVPAGVAPTAAVRFVVLADGKEVYRSPTRTSTEPPVSAAVAMKGVRQVTLRVEPTGRDTAAMGTPGVFVGAAVVK